MTSQPDASAVRDFLASASRRIAWSSALLGASAGLVIALAIAIVFSFAPAPRTGVLLLSGILLAFIGAIVLFVASRDDRRHVAYLVEQRVPMSRNVIVTASELDQHHVAPSVAELVLGHAAKIVRELDVAELFPLRNAITIAIAAVVAWASAVAFASRARTNDAVHGLSEVERGAAPPSIVSVDVIVDPPGYAGRPLQRFTNPARIDALAGSRIHVVTHARASKLVVETLDAHDTLGSPNGVFATDVVATTDGYIAFEPRSGNGRAGARRLVGLTVTPDAPARAHITAPGKDLFLDDAHRTLDVRIDASDDIGLASLALKYTKVSGSGERFTFTEGTVPIEIARPDSRTWTARARWNLESLGLTPGDMVVYRAVATDRRPGAAASESDSYIAEILAVGGGAAAGFSVDPEQERYAVSQQMVILETERLVAEQPKMAPDSFANASAELAAEQRKVRAEFVFMMGGELVDAPDAASSMTDINEEAEAQGEDDLLAGRNANKGRVALLRAIRAMSRAATSLNTADVTTALSHERAALAQLESAFSHARILLRALSERETLDMSRRLTGAFADATGEALPIAAARESERTTQLRAALAGTASLAGSTKLDPSASSRASMLAEEVLRIDASNQRLQGVATTLSSAAELLSRRKSGDAHRLLEQAADSLAGALRRNVLDAPDERTNIDASRLRGALRDALREKVTP